VSKPVKIALVAGAAVAVVVVLLRLRRRAAATQPTAGAVYAGLDALGWPGVSDAFAWSYLMRENAAASDAASSKWRLP
jgi:hypothetical protein